jgi:hypothetical protein
MQLCLREKVATGPPTMVGPGRRKVSAPAQPKVRREERRREERRGETIVR